MAKAGRNDPCPCGSGKKYKQCCGRMRNPPVMPEPEWGELDREESEALSALDQMLQDLGGMGPAEAFAAYAQPLIELMGDGEQKLEKALFLAQICWNLALIQDVEEREAQIEKMLEAVGGDEETRQAGRFLIDFMIALHQEMFPDLHQP